jgi:proteasome lid subunit RPN8/RPN11
VHRRRHGHRHGDRKPLITFTITSRALAAVVRHARQAQPAECCGLLLGRQRAIEEAAPARNLSVDPNRFEIDPAAHIAALRAARGDGPEVLGFYHSHPHSPAEPSETDLAEAAYPGQAYLIVSLFTEPPAVRLFVLDRERFAEVEYVEIR